MTEPPPGGWPTSVSGLTKKKRLGRGYFGEVWECKPSDKPDAAPWAVKMVPVKIIQSHNLSEQMDREITILRALKHPRIVECFFDFRDSSNIYIGMQFAGGGGMFDLLSRAGKFSNEKSAQYFYEMCDALEYIHNLSPPVIHRDIKPENILLDKDGHVLLADFGWSNIMDNASLRVTFCGTPDYLAPEMIMAKGHGASLDMWTMGVLLYEMTIGKSPFGGGNQEETCKRILKLDLRFPASQDKEAQDLVKNLCKLKPEERLTATQAKQHAFVKKYCTKCVKDIAAADAPDAAVGSSRWQQIQGNKIQQATGEMLQVLQAKSATEEKLLKVSQELDEAHGILRSVQRAKQKAEEAAVKLQAREAEQLAEIAELRQKIQK